jgi:hypothetical protein
MDSILQMLMHSIIIGFIAFIYMGLFGHNVFIYGFNGPFFKSN